MGRADVIVTFNLKDFDDAALPGELFAQSPDEFLLDVLGLYRGGSERVHNSGIPQGVGKVGLGGGLGE